MVQWLRFHAPKVSILRLIPGQETKSYMLQLKILRASTKIWYSQINKYIK